MAKFIIKRTLQGVLVLFIMSIFAYALINLTPGDPAAAIYGGQMDKLTQAERARINTNLGLDKPFVTRYINWLSEILNGRMGNSYANGKSVERIIAERLPNTLLLFTISFSLTVLLSIAVGLKAGLNPNTATDRGITIASITVNGIPSILVAIALIFIFAVKLKWLPSSGASSPFSGGAVDRIMHLILPVMTIIFSHVGAFSRFIQEGMKDEMGNYYVAVAKANHVSQADINRGVMKNALVPFINYAGTHIPSFFSGFVIIETVFSYPGLGNMIVGAIPVKDYPVLMGGILITGLVVVISILGIDIVELMLNPKLRKAAGQ